MDRPEQEVRNDLIVKLSEELHKLTEENEELRKVCHICEIKNLKRIMRGLIAMLSYFIANSMVKPSKKETDLIDQAVRMCNKE